MEIQNAMIPSSSGNISAMVDYPDKKTDKLAILCPGYLDSKDYKGLRGLAHELAKNGYVVVRFEPIGTWGSDGDISRYTTTQYLKDINTVLEYMLKQSRFNHVLLGGHSRGGHMSLLYASQDPRISGVVGIMPSSKRTALDGRHTEWKNKGFQISYRDLPNDKKKRKRFNVPFSHIEDHLNYDVDKEIRKIKVPVIIIAGELDTICPPDGVKMLFDNANKPKRFALIPKIGHDYRHNDNEVEIVDAEILKLMKEMNIL